MPLIAREKISRARRANPNPELHKKSIKYGSDHPNWKGGVSIHRPMETARDCAAFLGIFVTEQLLAGIFEHVKRMKHNNPGFDFYCGKGFKVDAKSGCLLKRHNDWIFKINQNKVADYFAIIGFDNRTDLNPLHFWLIPGKDINMKNSIHMVNSPENLVKWEKYEQPLDKILSCCNIMKSSLAQ
jgi:hypothetical protein